MDTLPTVACVLPPLHDLAGRTLDTLFPESRFAEANPRNKGLGGHLVEELLHLGHGNAALDLADGEIKTFDARPDGRPRGTVSVTVLDGVAVDGLLLGEPFDATRTFAKLRRAVLVGLVRPDRADPRTWWLLEPVFLGDEAMGWWLDRAAEDWEDIRERSCSRLALPAGVLGCTPGRDRYIQFRTKTSGSVTRPLYSDALGRDAALKGYGTYMTGCGLRAITGHPARMPVAC